ncbi:diguanylate phosphodiesterase [Xaviernesmea oryzae]|uniref:Diguanylate phosphodiesterase n=2 Tax=Xaviernesmea oryzae TaxID=464029 RepID=A0A1Q9B387_9HYPH|nr:diguanylate phosphodiesterase [Xaviernesmea oryzae]
MDLEQKRLHALRSLNLLDTAESESFDRITRMASQIFQLPIAAISLTDHDRQWFKSKVGVEHDRIPREKAPCAEVTDSRDLLIIEDFAEDSFYCDSVLGLSGVRFYAGAPLVTRAGHCLGALCVLGPEPRSATAAEIAALKDLSSLVMSQIELEHAFGRVDPTSGLPNRLQFTDDLTDLARQRPEEERVLVALDLAQPDQLERLSAVIGPSASDDLVQEAARSLTAFLGPAIRVYHVSPAQFVYLAPAGAKTSTYQPELLRLLQNELVSAELHYAITPVGVTTAFKPGLSLPADCLRSLSSAVRETRASERPIGTYSNSHDIDYQRKFRLLNDFSAALSASDQLRIVLQPRLDLHSQELLSAEVLLRWRHPELGDISPAEFVPIVENSALAWPMTQWVLTTALDLLKTWKAAGKKIKLSVNFSASNLKGDIVDSVLVALAVRGLDYSDLEIELTESTLMQNSTQVLEKLDRLVGSGVALAIDDFGTGYSSLSYLQRLPVSVVKIDRSFIMALRDGARERTLVQSMIKLSHEMGYRVVAEGIETGEAADMLRAMGCDEGQGYYYARPLEIGDFERMTRSSALTNVDVAV